MPKSRVIEEFLKISEEKAKSFKDQAKKSKEQLEKNPRVDSLSIEDIAKLYNVKPDAPKELTYKRNIIDVAHPNSVVISPSYDKLHGLIENENQRQDISLHILMDKDPTGQVNQRKYAEKELLLSLIRLGNTLDLTQDQDNLMLLSDACLIQVKNTSTIIKTAILPSLAVTALVAIPVLLRRPLFTTTFKFYF